MYRVVFFIFLIPVVLYSATFEISKKPPVNASRIADKVVVDGILDEPFWNDQAGYDYFTMRDPLEGNQPSEKTILYLVYDDNALYIGARMYDSSPDSIITRLGRRDKVIGADRVLFYVDPYHDRRSGYYFGLNAAGTIFDGTLFNDDNSDNNWDGIWEGRTHVDEQGWCAEMRIPFSQLRFKSTDTPWAVNFMRVIERKRENIFIAYTPKKESGFVSRFVDLTGITQMKSRNSLEVMPYVRGKADYSHPDAENPFNDGSKYTPGTGVDLKYRMGGNMVLDMTVNPDFGQVEVDPAVVNLSAYETYFPEKRPFFIEGASIFRFGRGGTSSNWGYSWDNPTFFYSRRIGRKPQREMPDYDYADIPGNTKILGAAKLTGKLGGNWNFGSINALTARESAEIDVANNRKSLEAEPRAYYGVMRAQKEVNDGLQGIGFMTTFVDRQFKDDQLRDDVNSESFALGMDGWTFLGPSNTWVFTGWLAASHIRGSAQRMINVQTSSNHYFQRPDAKSFSLDSTATSLTGTAGRFLLNKQKGRVIFNTAIGFVTPSYDVNDLGFMRTGNEVNGHVGTGYEWNEMNGLVRDITLIGTVFHARDFDGDITDNGIWHNGFFRFSNYSFIEYTASFETETIENSRTRGGPRITAPANWDGVLSFGTDSRKSFVTRLRTDFGASVEHDKYFGISADITWRPMPNLSLVFEPEMNWVHNKSQWVDYFSDDTATKTFGTRYVFASIKRKELVTGFRMNWTFTPKLTLQVYAQPLVSTGDYYGFKEFNNPGGYGYLEYSDDRVDFDVDDNYYTIDPDGTGGAESFRFDNPDFDFKSLRGNAVLRWEYLPGSTLYLVWTQERSDSEYLGDFKFNRSLDRMWSSQANNIFMMKLTHWFTL